MGGKVGMRNNPDGRPKGSINKRSLEWDILKSAIIGRHAERFNTALNNLSDKEFTKAYTAVLGHFKPRLQSVGLDANVKSNPVIVFQDISNQKIEDIKEDIKEDKE